MSEGMRWAARLGLAGSLAVPCVAQAEPLAPAAAPAALFAGGVLVGAVGTLAVGAVARRVAGRGRGRAEEQPRPVADAPLAAGDAGPSHVPSHGAHDYEDIAENYVGRARFRERMATRAQGVAETLRQRMGSGMMEGVPVIERADGSVGDVGTSWWTTAVGRDAIISDSGFAPDDDIAIPSDFCPDSREELRAAARGVAGSIASRVASVAPEGSAIVAPADAAAAQADADWASAMRCLDEAAASEAPGCEPVAFDDAVGGADTLDEPDGIEPRTTFIPFRTPAGHPEVVDTESYVDYLIGDEFGKNESASARQSSRRFLRVLEGGTHSSRRVQASEGAYVPKHFAREDAARA